MRYSLSACSSRDMRKALSLLEVTPARHTTVLLSNRSSAGVDTGCSKKSCFHPRVRLLMRVCMAAVKFRVLSAAYCRSWSSWTTCFCRLLRVGYFWSGLGVKLVPVRMSGPK